MNRDVRERALRRAYSECNAALLLSTEKTPWSTSEVTHLNRGWRLALFAFGTGDLDADDHVVGSDLAELPGIDMEEGDLLARALGSDKEHEPSPSDLLHSARALRDCLRTLDRDFLGNATQQENRRRWRARAFFAAGLVLALAVWVAVKPAPDGPWRGAYFAYSDFKGKPFVQRDDDVRFDWGTDGPLSALPMENFSIQWDSCLVVSKPTSIRFELVADDWAELWRDGELLTKAVGRHPGAEYQFVPGTHHLQVRYGEALDSANVRLSASVEQGAWGPLPKDLLRFPGEQLAEGAACSGVR